MSCLENNSDIELTLSSCLLSLLKQSWSNSATAAPVISVVILSDFSSVDYNTASWMNKRRFLPCFQEVRMFITTKLDQHDLFHINV